MALINKATVDEINQRLFDTYKEFAAATDSSVGPMVLGQSTGGRKQFVHSFFGGLPKERVWNGERIVKSLKLNEITGTTEKYELTLGLDVEDALSDVLAPYVQSFQQFGKLTGRLLDRRVAEFLSNVTSSDTLYQNYDGNALFTATHSLQDGTTQSNLISSNALNHANLITSWEAMRAMSDDYGNPLSFTPKYLIVPSALELTARELVAPGQMLLNDGDSNILRGMLEVIVLPELDSSSATSWYLAAGEAPAFVNHELTSPDVVSKTSMSDDNVFWLDELVYGWTARSRLLAGPYQLLQRNNA
jgi:phage major head subunit gpT-like protein